MIKINWHEWFYDRIIFGWYHYSIYVADFDLVNPTPIIHGTAKKVWLTKWQWNWKKRIIPFPVNGIPWHRCFMRADRGLIID